MNIIKLIFVAIGIAIIISVFSDNLPGQLEINGKLLEANEDNKPFNSNKYDAFTYSSYDSNNHLMLMFRKNEELSLHDLEELVLKDFKNKGYKIINNGSNHIVINDNQGMYLAIAQDINALALYSEISIETFLPKPENSLEIFTDLVNIYF